jgi:uncharacterized metal-binding protein YceD (DUF177 family)
MKDLLRTYDIKFAGLKAGKHDYSFVLDRDFYALFENSLITNALVNVAMVLDKFEHHFDLDISANGYIHLACDRCLDMLALPISFNQRILVKEGNIDDSTDEIVYLSPNSYEFSCAQLLFELVHMQVPLRMVCGENEIPACDKPNPFENIFETEVTTEEETSDFVDPRWEKLKNLKS